MAKQSYNLSGMIIPGYIVNSLFGIGKIPLIGSVISGILTGGQGGGLFGLRYEYVKKPNVHSATWYNMHGHKTASGERFHKDSLTAAYNYSKLGTYLRVTNPSTNLSVIVKVNDRMGYKGRNHIDLSKCAFDSIGNTGSGRIKVIVEEIKN